MNDGNDTIFGGEPNSEAPHPVEETILPDLDADDRDDDEIYDNDVSRFSLRSEAGFDWTQMQNLKNAIEKRLKPLDFGEVLMGRATQPVPIIPGKFSVTYRMITAGHRGALAREMNRKHGVENTPEAAYYSQLVSLACTISALQDQEISDPLIRSKGEFDAKTLAANVQIVGNLPDTVFFLVWFNHQWFQVRVQDMLTMEALKNG